MLHLCCRYQTPSFLTKCEDAYIILVRLDMRRYPCLYHGKGAGAMPPVRGEEVKRVENRDVVYIIRKIYYIKCYEHDFEFAQCVKSNAAVSATVTPSLTTTCEV